MLRKPSAVAQFGGKTLDALMLSATLNPGQLSIVREIVDGDLDNTATDVAVYGDLRANYTITSNADGSITVEHVTVTVETDPTTGNNRVSDGIDRLFNIEKLKFADRRGEPDPAEAVAPCLRCRRNYRRQLQSTATYSRNGWQPSAWTPTGSRRR